MILCYSPIQSVLSMKSTGANDTQFTEVLRQVFSRPSFSFRSLLSRTRRNLSINKTKLHLSVAFVSPLFFSYVRFFQSKLSPRLSALGQRPLRPLWLPQSRATALPPPPSPPSRGISTLILRLGRVPFTRCFLPPFPFALPLMLFLVGGPPFARCAIEFRNSIRWHYLAYLLQLLVIIASVILFCPDLMILFLRSKVSFKNYFLSVINKVFRTD